MRNNTLRNRIKAVFLTAALIGSTLMGAIPAHAAPETGADEEQVTASVPTVVTGDGKTVELPIEQYLNISSAATAKWPTLEGTYTVTPTVGEFTATELTLTNENKELKDTQAGKITLTFPQVGVYEGDLNISAEATDPYNESSKEKIPEQKYHLRAYVKNDGKGGFITAITAADEFGNKVEKIVYGVCADDPPVVKNIEGDISKNEKFKFHLKPAANSEDYTPMPVGTTYDADKTGEKTVDAPAGHVEFGWLFFDRAGSYRYNIWEEAGDNLYIGYDDTEYTKEIIVENEGGQLQVVSSTYSPQVGTTAIFTNTSAGIIIEAPDREKVYDGITVTDAELQAMLKVTMPDGYKESDYNFEYTFADGQTVRNVGTYTIITGVRITDKRSGAVVATYGTMIQNTASAAEVLKNAAGEFVRVITFSPMVTYAAQAKRLGLTVVPGSYKITPREVTVTADSVTRAQSDPDPAFTATVDGVLAGEENLISYSLARNSATNEIGSHTGEIIPSGSENQGNYHVTFISGDLIITGNGGGGGGPSGGGGSSSGGGRRSRPETSNNPTPTTPGEVLGATRDAAEDAGRGVLGAVRNPQGQVLGAVRTGDSSAMVTWAVILMLAASGIVGWFNMYQRRKRNV